MKFAVRFFCLFWLFVMAMPMQAEEVTLGTITISNPYIRFMPASAKVTSGYLEIRNEGQEADRLIQAYSPAARIEIHEMWVENDVMRMRPLAEGLELPAGETVSLTSGGYHLMIFEPKALLKGGTFPIELHFASSGKVDVNFKILDIGETKASGTPHNHGH